MKRATVTTRYGVDVIPQSVRVEAAMHTQLIRRSLAAALTTLLITVGPALALAPAGTLE